MIVGSRLFSGLMKYPVLRKNFSRSNIKKQIQALKTPYGNVTEKIISLAERNLLAQRNHPLGILREKIENFFNDDKVFKSPLHEKLKTPFAANSTFSPIVSVKQNFDDLMVPKNHISRKRSDTYYINEEQLLRTHTTANEKLMFEQGHKAFLIFADCYRRDEIDGTHYPVFHQMEAVKSFKRSDFKIDQEDVMTSQILKDLHTTWESLVQHIIGNVQMRWVPTTFPFTDHSAELQIFYQGQWMEILGCGILKRDVMRNYGRPEDEVAWASGAGLERLAINLFEIPDIRLFWSQDERFLNQFQPGKITKFKPFSQFPICYKDVTFWINNLPNFEENDFYEVVRSNGGDLIEKAQCVDTYHDQKSNRTSQCFRIHYRSLEKTLLNSEIDEIQNQIREQISSQLGHELR